ncbi:MAG: UvrD-helicase domain-containing protein [Alphaproteobacteria bacterium]
MMKPISPFVENLNPAQQEAILNVDGPLLVLAGAGTGKTRVLTSRLAQILYEQKAWPSEILAVTFTNKAALEMKTRIASLISQNITSMWIGTFHAIGVRILRRHAELVGLTSGFTIINPDDQERIVKQLLQVENMDDKKQTARLFVHIINGWKDKALTPDKITEQYLGWDQSRKALKIYRLYQERLKIVNAADFGDLLLHCLTIFSKHPDVLKEYLGRFKYILVDEYQDTNITQYLFLRLLAQGTGNICCVGDDDQSIYGWRGAEIGNILKFEKDFPGAKTIRLEQNYRSTPAILGAASGLIAHNKSRLGKTLWTEKDAGEPVYIKGLFDGKEEAQWVADQIEHYQRKGISLSHMAILMRAGYQTREFEEVFLTRAIPYKIIGGLRFYERMEIRDALAYLRVIVQPNDDLAFERIINVPKRGIGESTVQKMYEVGRSKGIPLTEAAHIMIEEQEIKGKTRLTLKSFLDNLERWRQLIPQQNHEDLVKTVLDESGYTAMWKSDKSIDATGRLDNLKELVRAVGQFSDLYTFLEHVSLVMENTTTAALEDSVTLMTIHASKGLEFDTVFLAGWEEGIFPSQKSLEEGEGIEEERRLAYVALTRAKRQAYITFASSRRLHGQWQNNLPSRFIKELPPEHICFLESSFVQRPSAHSYGIPAKPKGSMVIEQPAAPHGFKPGNRVFHEKFGYGYIQTIYGEQLVINFEHAGPKNVLHGFVKKSG